MTKKQGSKEGSKAVRPPATVTEIPGIERDLVGSFSRMLADLAEDVRETWVFFEPNSRHRLVAGVLSRTVDTIAVVYGRPSLASDRRRLTSRFTRSLMEDSDDNLRAVLEAIELHARRNDLPALWTFCCGVLGVSEQLVA